MGDDVGYCRQDGHTFRPLIKEGALGSYIDYPHFEDIEKHVEGLCAKRIRIRIKKGILEILGAPSDLV